MVNIKRRRKGRGKGSRKKAGDQTVHRPDAETKEDRDTSDLVKDYDGGSAKEFLERIEKKLRTRLMDPDPDKDEDAKEKDEQDEKLTLDSDALGRQAQGEEKSEEEESKGLIRFSPEQVIARVHKVIGFEELASLCENIHQMAPVIHKRHLEPVIMQQAYLFCCEPECGSDIAARALADMLNAEGLAQAPLSPINIGSIAGEDEDDLVNDNAIQVLAHMNDKVVLMDITLLIDDISSLEFRNFLMQVTTVMHGSNIVPVFLTPYLENDTLKMVQSAIMDVINLETVVFNPLSLMDLIETGMQQLAEFGYQADAYARTYYRLRLQEEMSDGRFYGFQTTGKVAQELVMEKLRSIAGGYDEDDDVIRAESLPIVHGILNEMLQSVSAGDTADTVDVSDASDTGDPVDVSDAADISDTADRPGSYDKGNKSENSDEPNGFEDCQAAEDQIFQDLDLAFMSLTDMEEIAGQLKEFLHIYLLDPEHREPVYLRFIGNEGTGKLAAARILTHVLRHCGVLTPGILISHTGDELLGFCAGHTGPTVSRICRDAYGSVLFIDNASELRGMDEEDRKAGQEAIRELSLQIKEMEENHMLVILADKSRDMAGLLKHADSLNDIPAVEISFPSCSRTQLSRIFLSKLEENGFEAEDGLEEHVLDYFEHLGDNIINFQDFANGRFVENFFYKTCSKALTRCELEKAEAGTILIRDFDAAAVNVGEYNGKFKTRLQMGFHL